MKQWSMIEVGIVANNDECIGTQKLSADEERMDVVEVVVLYAQEEIEKMPNMFRDMDKLAKWTKSRKQCVTNE